MADSLLEQPEFMALDLRIIPGRHEVRAGELVIKNFSLSEFRILQILASRPGWIYSREKIIYTLRGQDYSCTERAVDQQICGIRKKFRENGIKNDYIELVRGVGYRFKEKYLSS